MREAKIFVAYPFYGQAYPSSVLAATLLASQRDDYSIKFQPQSGSFLIANFNKLWGQALKLYCDGEVTHFAMLHSDIIPEAGWLDVLLDEMTRLGADVVSAVSPIKDRRGLTSTGIDVDDSGFHVRRITMREVMRLPETFSTKDLDSHGIPSDGRGLLINTGCWLADLSNPLWYELKHDNEYKISFTVRSRLIRNEDGTPQTEVESEDWYFSRLLHYHGMKYYATRKVPLKHIGDFAYPNDQEWGTVADESDKIIAVPA